MEIVVKKSVLGLAVAGAFFASNVLANDSYRFEAGLSYSEIESFDVIAVEGTYYFSDVAVSSLPRSEAAFYQHKSYVQLGYASADGDVDALAAQARVFIPNSMFMLGAGLTRVDANGFDDTLWNASLGLALAPGLLVWTEFEEDLDYDDAINVHAKYVKPLDNGTAYNLEGYVVKYDHGNEFNFGGDYFFDQNLSLGALATVYDFDEDDFTGYEIRARNFFTNQFSMGLAYTNVDSADGFYIDARLRF